jgi:16S rRNA (guanine527-N7)-methyltransferase
MTTPGTSNDALRAAADSLKIDLSARQLGKFAAYSSTLREWNRRVNLTRIDEADAIELRHFVDSLTCAIPVLDAIRAGRVERCIDVGSGAGFPGLAMAIAFPYLRMTLVEATGKKARFLEHVARTLELSSVEMVAERAELTARRPGYRDSFDLVVARALAPLPVALELCLPFAQPGGRLVLPRGIDPPAQLKDAACAADELGARLLPPVSLHGLSLPPERRLVVAEKVDTTDDRYPRRPGVAAKRPLHCPKLPLA